MLGWAEQHAFVEFLNDRMESIPAFGDRTRKLGEGLLSTKSSFQAKEYQAFLRVRTSVNPILTPT